MNRMTYTIRYYRDEETSLRYKMFGGLDKPAGWHNGQMRYETRLAAQCDADYINKLWRPEHEVEVVRV